MSEETNELPSPDEVQDAVRVLIRWFGDSPQRAGLLATPKKVLEGSKSVHRGYTAKTDELKSALLENDCGYSDFVLFKGINFSSTCEHHLVPMVGKVSIAYVPDSKMLGIGRVLKVVDVFVKRLQLQERLTVQIACFLHELLAPKGVAVFVEAKHLCVEYCEDTAGGCESLQTSSMLGVFRDNIDMRREFFYRLKM